MTPVQGWAPADYFAARDAARRAFDRTNQQLMIGGLDEGVARAGSDLSLAAAPSSSPPAAAPSPRAGSTSKHTNGGAAPVPSDERGIPEKGAYAMTATAHRVFTRNEQENRDAWVTSRIENDCDGCEAIYYQDGEAWRPAERCPVHGVDCADWWAELNSELDRRWPGRWEQS